MSFFEHLSRLRKDQLQHGIESLTVGNRNRHEIESRIRDLATIDHILTIVETMLDDAMSHNIDFYRYINSVQELPDEAFIQRLLEHVDRLRSGDYIEIENPEADRHPRDRDPDESRDENHRDTDPREDDDREGDDRRRRGPPNSGGGIRG